MSNKLKKMAKNIVVQLFPKPKPARDGKEGSTKAYVSSVQMTRVKPGAPAKAEAKAAKKPATKKAAVKTVSKKAPAAKKPAAKKPAAKRAAKKPAARKATKKAASKK